MKLETLKLQFFIEDDGTESKSDIGITISARTDDGSSDDGRGRMFIKFRLNEEEFKAFRSEVRDFYTKKEQEEHFAMMSQDAPSYSMTDMMVDKGSI